MAALGDRYWRSLSPLAGPGTFPAPIPQPFRACALFAPPVNCKHKGRQPPPPTVTFNHHAPVRQPPMPTAHSRTPAAAQARAQLNAPDSDSLLRPALGRRGASRGLFWFAELFLALLLASPARMLRERTHTDHSNWGLPLLLACLQARPISVRITLYRAKPATVRVAIVSTAGHPPFCPFLSHQ